jgi:hypothetical protein
MRLLVWRKESVTRPYLQRCFGKIFEVWVFVIHLIFSLLGADDFTNFFYDLSDPQVIVPPDPVRLDDTGFSFRHVDGDECLAAFMFITSNAIGSDGNSLKFLKLLLPFSLFDMSFMIGLSDYVEKCYCSVGGQTCFSVMSVRFSSNYDCVCFVQGV